MRLLVVLVLCTLLHHSRLIILLPLPSVSKCRTFPCLTRCKRCCTVFSNSFLEDIHLPFLQCKSQIISSIGCNQVWKFPLKISACPRYFLAPLPTSPNRNSYRDDNTTVQHHDGIGVTSPGKSTGTLDKESYRNLPPVICGYKLGGVVECSESDEEQSSSSLHPDLRWRRFFAPSLVKNRELSYSCQNENFHLSSQQATTGICNV